MKPLNFLFAVHNHQPVGNFPSVFKKAFADCYLPFLREVMRHPGFKFSVHFSGPLWEYMQAHEKEGWAIIAEMAGRGQVEILSGGFYEPILCIIPEEDRIGQVSMMNDFIRENFGLRPRGLWLTERVWEPHLPKSLAEAGIEYTLLDEEHFHYAGVKDIHTSYITEDDGRPLRIFPIDKKLRYLIPFHLLDEVDAYLKSIHEKGGSAILGDDGEKFGLWPGTHKWVYEEGWLRTFLEFIEAENVNTMTFSEYIDSTPPGGRVYLPPASYEEMMEWVLEPDEYRALKRLKESASEAPGSGPGSSRFLRGGFFRDFLLKYPESGHLHKRMLLVSHEVASSPARTNEARMELYKGQCNDPYWHGVFGGLYLPHLRQSAYAHLIEAEKSLALEPGYQEFDFDLDGRNEVLYRSARFNFFFKPSFGGALTEIDYLPDSRNFSNVLARRPESYHASREEEKSEGKSIHEIAKRLPPEAKDLLRYDWHPRYSLLDHFLHPETTRERFLRVDYGEQGDFVNQPYGFRWEGNSLFMEREGGVWLGSERIQVLVRKELRPSPGGLHIFYEVENLSSREAEFLFGSEWNIYLISSEIEVRGNRASFLGGRLVLEPGSPAALWHFPLRTLSQSEEGYDIIHQGFCLLPLWKINAPGKGKYSFELKLKETHGT